MHSIHFPSSKIAITGLIVGFGLLLVGATLAILHMRSENSVALSMAEMSGQANANGTSPAPAAATVADQNLHHYIEITNGCAWDYSDACVNMRSGPGTSYPVLLRLRTGIILEVEAATVQASDGSEWYKIIPDKNILYPDRLPAPWYVAVDPSSVRAFDNPGEVDLAKDSPSTGKRIVVDPRRRNSHCIQCGRNGFHAGTDLHRARRHADTPWHFHHLQEDAQPLHARPGHRV